MFYFIHSMRTKIKRNPEVFIINITLIYFRGCHLRYPVQPQSGPSLQSFVPVHRGHEAKGFTFCPAARGLYPNFNPKCMTIKLLIFKYLKNITFDLITYILALAAILKQLFDGDHT